MSQTTRNLCAILILNNCSYIVNTPSTVILANPDPLDMLYGYSEALTDFHIVCHSGPPPSPPHKIFSFKKWRKWQVCSYTLDGASWISSGPYTGPYCPYTLKTMAVLFCPTSRALLYLQSHGRYLYCNCSSAITLFASF